MTTAEFIIRNGFQSGLCFRDAILLGIHALAAAKQHEPYCGGPSQFVRFENGFVSGLVPFDVREAEQQIMSRFQQESESVLLAIANDILTQEQFRDRLQQFASMAQGMRTSIAETGAHYRDLIKSLDTRQ